MNNARPEWMDELVALAAATIEGTITEQERARLEALVLHEAAARTVYVELLHEHACLSWSMIEPGLLQDPLVDEDRSKILSLVSAQRPPRWRRTMAYALTTAAALVVGVWFGLASHSRSIEPEVATLVEARECTWKSGTLPTEAGAKLSPGRLQLAGGLARIRFAQGAEISLEAPADLELVSPSRCILHAGRLVAKVPPQAIGFVVETREAILRDLGTEFGVSVTNSGTADVQVFTGLVDVEPRPAGTTRRIAAGQGLLIDKAGMRSYHASEEPAPPPSAEPPADAQWLQITTAVGRGKESCVQSSWPPKHTSDVLLLVKNEAAADSKFQRKAYLGFDLAALEGRKLADAQLKLSFEPTMMGYASRFPQATFAVYGLIDESLDGWQESSIRWENAPANGPGGGGIDLAKVVLLGRFVVEARSQQAAQTISGPALADFLNRDTNGLATLIVLRETAYEGKDSLVHGFASRRHSDSPPPTLKLTLAGPQ